MKVIKRILLVTFAAILLLIGTIWVILWQMEKSATREFEANASATLNSLQQVIDGDFKSIVSQLEDLSTSPAVAENISTFHHYKVKGEGLSPGELEIFKKLDQVKKTFSGDSWVYAANLVGGFVCSPNVYDASYDPTQREWFTTPVNTGKLYAKLYNDRDDVMLNAVVPVFKPNTKKIIGVVGADVAFKSVSQEFAKARVGKEGYVLMFVDDNKIISPDVRVDWSYRVDEMKDLPEDAQQALLKLKASKILQEVTFKGKTWLGLSKTMANGWIIIAFEEKHKPFEGIFQDLGHKLFVLIVVIVSLVTGETSWHL